MDAPIREAVAIGYDGIDVYGFHSLETLQCMVERRVGGESGVAAVTCLEGDAVWRAAEAGRWSRSLGEAAFAQIKDKPAGSMEEVFPAPAVFLIEYRDGFRAAVLISNRCSKGVLLPEQKVIDYVLLIRPDKTRIDESELLSNLKNAKVILGVYRLEVLKLKSKDNLLF